MPNPDDDDEAGAYSDALRSDRGAKEREVRANTWGDSVLDDLQADLAEHGIALSEVVNVAAAELFEMVARHILERPDLAYAHGVVERTRFVVIDDDSVAASSQRFADGAGLIRMSDGMYSLAGHLAEVGQLVLRGGASLPSTLAGAAALRFHIHQRRAWGLPGKIGAADHRIGLEESERGTAALLFIVAHELGHLSLDHPDSATARTLPLEGRHSLEFAADEFAASVLDGMEQYGALPSGAAREGVRLGLLAAAFEQDAVFFTPPRSHPSLASRWERWSAGESTRDVASAARAAYELAINMDEALPEEAWSELFESALWNTSVLKPEQYQIVLQLDAITNYTSLGLTNLLDKFNADGAPNLGAILRGLSAGMALDDTLSDLGVGNESAQALLVTQITHHQLVHEISSSEVWHSAGGRFQSLDFLRIVASLACVRYIKRHLDGQKPSHAA